MKNSLCVHLSALVLAILVAGVGPLRADSDQMVALTKELKDQQKQIDENQTKLDSKLADLAEAVRTARLYSSRLGGNHGAPTPTPPPPPKPVKPPK